MEREDGGGGSGVVKTNTGRPASHNPWYPAQDGEVAARARGIGSRLRLADHHPGQITPSTITIPTIEAVQIRVRAKGMANT